MKRYSEYKDSGVEWIGQVPMDWRINRLKRICTFNYGDSLSNEDRSEGEVPVYGSNGVVGYHNKAITCKPCIIIGRKGSYGKVNFSHTECFPIDTTYFVDGRSAKCDLKWLDYLLPLLELDKFSKDTGVPGLNREDAHNKKVPIPELDVQKELVNYLNRKTEQIDDLIAKKERMIELLKEERMAVINQAVTKGLDPNVEMKPACAGASAGRDSGIEWLGKIPKHWGIKKLKFLSKKIGSGVTPKGGASIYVLDGVLFLRSQNIHFNGLRLDDVAYIPEDIHKEMINTRVLPGDVLLNITGASIGRCYYFPNDLGEANVNQHVCIIRPNNMISTKYLTYCLSSGVGQEQITNQQVGISREGLNFEELASFQIPIGKIKEQNAIVGYLDKKTKQIDQQIDMAKRSIDLLKEYRTALISEAVTGKIDVSTSAVADVRSCV